MTDSIRVLVADDRLIVREGLRLILETAEGIELVGEAVRLARGERSKEIAAQLGITERTVKAHLTSIYNKLGVDSRAAAIAVASHKGWLEAAL